MKNEKNANRLFFIWNIINLMSERAKKGLAFCMKFLSARTILVELPQAAFDDFAAVAP